MSKTRESSPHQFRKKYGKSTNKVLSSYTAVWKSRRKHDHDFYRKIRQTNVFTKEVTKELISRNFFYVIAFFSIFPHCVVEGHEKPAASGGHQ